MINTIIFDIGNVIVCFDHRGTCEKLAKKSEYSPAEIYDYIFNTSLVEEYDGGKISSRQFYKRIEDHVKPGINYDMFFDIWGDIFILDESVEEIIKDLYRKTELYLLSNTNELHFLYLKKNFGFFKYFNKNFLSYEEKFKKPDIRIFNSVLKKIDAVPQDIIYIDYKEENVEGFSKLGVNGIVFYSGIRLKEDLLRLGISIKE